MPTGSLQLLKCCFVWIFLYSAATAWGLWTPMTSTAVSVSSGRELALALSLQTVEVITVEISIRLSDDDYVGLGALPLQLDRNVTIFGSQLRRAAGDVVALDGGFVKDKVRIGAGVTLMLVDLVLTRYRQDVPSSTPGIDLLAPSANTSAAGPAAGAAPISSDTNTTTTTSGSAVAGAPGPPLLLLLRVALNNRLCFPASWSRKSVQATPRPAFWPGPQNATSDLPQDDCIHDASAPWLRRCWAVRRHYNDIGTPGKAVMGALGVPEPTNYYVRALDSPLLCDAVMPEDCITTFTVVGCFYQFFPRAGMPVAGAGLAAAGPTGDAGGGGGGGGGEDGGGGAGGMSGAQLAGVLAGVIGGVLLLALVSLAVVAWRRGWRGRGKGPWTPRWRFLPAGKRVLAGAAASGAGAGSCEDGDGACGGGGGGANPDGSLGLAALPKQQASQQNQLQAGSSMGGASSSMYDASQSCSTDKASGIGYVQHRLLSDPAVPVTSLTPCRTDMRLLPSTSAASHPGSRSGSGHGHGGAGPPPGERPPEGADDEVKLVPNATRGKGSFGHVVEGVYQGQRVAVKLVADAHMWGGPQQSLVTQFRQEVEVLGRCQHPNVVRLLAACLTPPRLCLVMELMETSLERLLYGGGRSGALMPLPKVLHIALEIAKGLEYLHPTIVHRDLKPANVLLNSAWSDLPVVKITDFGLSRLRTTAVPTATPDAGTPAYLSPEGFDAFNFIITHKTDIYSLAVVLWEMLEGDVPWRGCSVVEVAYKVTNCGLRLPLEHLPEARCPAKLKQLIQSCWDSDPRRRPAAAEVVKSLALIQQQQATGESTAGTVTATLSCSASSTDAAPAVLMPRRVLSGAHKGGSGQEEPAGAAAAAAVTSAASDAARGALGAVSICHSTYAGDSCAGGQRLFPRALSDDPMDPQGSSNPQTTLPRLAGGQEEQLVSARDGPPGLAVAVSPGPGLMRRLSAGGVGGSAAVAPGGVPAPSSPCGAGAAEMAAAAAAAAAAAPVGCPAADPAAAAAAAVAAPRRGAGVAVALRDVRSVGLYGAEGPPAAVGGGMRPGTAGVGGGEPAVGAGGDLQQQQQQRQLSPRNDMAAAGTHSFLSLSSLRAGMSRVVSTLRVSNRGGEAAGAGEAARGGSGGGHGD